MVDIIKQNMADIWASSGDVQAPDSAKIATGWVVEAVPRQWWNWFENRQDTNIAYILQKGFPEWDSTTDYISNKSYVQRNGTVYRATEDSTNSDPVTLTSWIKVFADYSPASNALGALSPIAGGVPFFINGTTASTAQSTPFGRGHLNSADAASARSYISAQPVNDNLTALSGVVANVNTIPYFNSLTTMTGTTITSLARTFISLGTVAAQRSALEVSSTGDTQALLDGKQPLSANLTSFAGLSGTVNTIPYFTAANVLGLSPITAFTRNFLSSADAASSRTYLGLGNTATLNIGNSAGTVAAGDDARILDALPKSGNLSGLANVATSRSNLGLGTSATINAQTNPLDTTVGRVLTTGAFGLGGSYLLSNPDLTALRPSGFYYCSAAINQPPSVSGYGFLLVQSIAGYQTQMFIDVSSGKKFTNSYTGASWTVWSDVYNSAEVSSFVQSFMLTADASSARTLLGLTTSSTTVAATANTANTLVLRDSNGDFTTGRVTASFTGNGASITNLNASNITSGAVPVANGGTGTTATTGTGANVLSGSPDFTGVPRAPTAVPGAYGTQIANTKWVLDELGTATNPVISKEFTSPPQTTQITSTVTLAHGMAVKPKLVQVVLRCLTAELGYSVGDDVVMVMGASTSATSDGIAIACDATNIRYRFGAVGTPLVLNLSTGVVARVTLANWQTIVKAYA